MHNICLGTCTERRIGCKKSRLDFMTGWCTSMQLMEGEGDAGPDLLAGLFGDDSKEVFDALLVLLTEDDDQQGDS